MVDREIRNSYYIFKSLTKKPQDYLSYQDNIAGVVKELVKNLYDITKHSENKFAGSTALSELIVDSFDEEQIWQELELQNNDWNNTFMSDILKFIVKKDNVLFPVNINGPEDKDTVNSKISGRKLNETENTNYACDNSNFKEIDTINFNDDDDDDDMGSGCEYSISSNLKHEVIEDLYQKNEKSGVKNPERQKLFEVDDKFFKLSEMEKFLESEDQRNQNVNSKHNFCDSDSDIDYFADDLRDEGYDIEKQRMGADYKYEAFFTTPEDLNKNKAWHVRLKDNDAELQTGENVSNNDNTDNSYADSKEMKSSFEERQERVQKKIKKLEEEALQEKPWQLSGEVEGSARPQNSLLEEFVDFDIMTRPAPVITEETTIRLEDIIIRRIKDKSWDDVERKIKPVETTELNKKTFVLDQERSKLSLAEVYEQEYVKQRDLVVKNHDEFNEKKDIEPRLHTDVQALMTSLFNKLDALSNFHYTPRPVVPELKVVSNIPAINMEEVAPVAASNSMLLAPEEIQGSCFKTLINKGERTVTDKKRALRNKKKKQRKRAREIMKKNVSLVEKKIDDHSYKIKKKHKRENKMNVSSHSLSTSHSSKTFFCNLQEVNSSIKRKVKSQDQSKILDITAAHLKL